MLESLEQDLTRHGSHLQPDFRAFLLACAATGESSLIVPEQLPPATASIPDVDHTLHEEVGRVYLTAGVRSEIAEAGFWHPGACRHAIPVAKSYGGDRFVQIVRGRHEGAIYFVNHETWSEGLGALVAGNLDDVDEDLLDVLEDQDDLEIDDPASMTTDQFVAVGSLEDLDTLVRVADSFDAFHALLAARHE